MCVRYIKDYSIWHKDGLYFRFLTEMSALFFWGTYVLSDIYTELFFTSADLVMRIDSYFLGKKIGMYGK